MERKLVTIRKVSEIKSIKDADLIELAIVDGWQCVVSKGDFRVGDYGVYFEIDSFLPIKPRYEFLRKSSYKKIEENGQEGFRLRTMKLRGQLSQGLLMPISKFEELIGKEIPVGEDISEMLGVIKYEPPIPASLSGEVYGLFPSFIPKTDAERIQNLINEYPSIFKDDNFEVTVKLDGSSMTIYKKDEHIGVCSRNLELREKENNALWRVAKNQSIIQSLIESNKNYAIQGELCGPGIQGNKEKLQRLDFRIFEIYDIDTGKYLTPQERYEYVEKYKLLHVPVLYPSIKFFEEFKTLEGMLAFAELDLKREGIVVKHIQDGSIKFKVISNKYLLKNE